MSNQKRAEDILNILCGQEQKTIGKDKCTTHYNAATKTSQVICVPGEDIQTVNNW